MTHEWNVAHFLFILGQQIGTPIEHWTLPTMEVLKLTLMPG